MSTGIDPTVDFAFKRVFAAEENSSLLVHFLNAVLMPHGGREIVSAEILTPINEPDTSDDKLTVVDLRVRDSDGRHIIIEMQVVVAQAFRERLLYYACRDLVQQLPVGADYSTLVPTILICVVSRFLFRRDPGHHFRFRLTADGCSEDFSNHLEIHTIELGKFDAPGDGLQTALDQWLFFLKNGEELDVRDLPPGLAAPEVRRAVEVLDMISQSERDRVKYEVELKHRRDLINRDKLIFGQGRDEGREEGLEQGRLIASIQLIARLLGEPVPSLEELRPLSLETLTEKADELTARARERGLPV